jgi:4-hydroxybenzoate polyprenyltransferase
MVIVVSWVFLLAVFIVGMYLIQWVLGIVSIFFIACMIISAISRVAKSIHSGEMQEGVKSRIKHLIENKKTICAMTMVWISIIMLFGLPIISGVITFSSNYDWSTHLILYIGLNIVSLLFFFLGLFGGDERPNKENSSTASIVKITITYLFFIGVGAAIPLVATLI